MKSLLAFRALALALTANLATPAPVGREAFRQEMRRLWEDHVMWTRLYIVSAIDGLADLDPTAQRLLRNQADIGDAVKPFYGEASGAKLTALLRGHILGAAELVGAAKAADRARVAAASSRWYANADEIATFLSSANPQAWPEAALQSMMRQHLDETLVEATARLQGRHADEIAAYDRIHQHILMMADALSDGIISQFPASFR